jgi:sulfatase maturation enzyme AslB (radical SAM superfamily)
MSAIVSGVRRIGFRWAHAAVWGDGEARLTAFELAAVESVAGRPVRVQSAGFDGTVSLDDLGRLVDECAPTSLARRADDSVRIACFQGLALTRLDGSHSTHAETLVEATLGPVDSWIGAYRRHLHTREARVVLVPTWQCELRCVYCTIGKTGGKEMDDVVGMESLDLLFSAPSPDLCLAFFGGEPLLRWPLVRRLCDAATERARSEGRTLSIQLTTNAWALTEEIASAMAKWNIHLQLSLDGDEATQNAQRKPWGGAGDSYERGPAKHIESMHKYGVNYQVIMVVTPKNVSDMARNFQHLIDLGARCVQLNYAIGIPWSVEAAEQYAEGLQAISERVEAVWADGGEFDWVNVRETVTAVRNNLHVTVDFDGSIYGGNAFLFQAVSREEFLLGELKDRHSWHRYMVDGRSDADVFAHWKRRATVVETTRVGSVVASFVRWMQARHPERLGQHKTRSM